MQSIVLLYMAMGEKDVSKVKMGSLTDYSLVNIMYYNLLICYEAYNAWVCELKLLVYPLIPVGGE